MDNPQFQTGFSVGLTPWIFPQVYVAACNRFYIGEVRKNALQLFIPDSLCEYFLILA